MWQIFVITAFLGPAWGISAYKKALEVKSNKYIDSGTFIGGEAGESYSLLKVRRQMDTKSGIERIVLNLGDQNGKILKGKTGFFQINLEPKAGRIVIHLSQVNQSQVSPTELASAFKESPFVKSTEMILDPEAASTNLVLNLKTSVKAEVIELSKKGKPGRIVLDLKKRG
ncbi:hypothetical protein GW916_13205 [bacterium]|nr:hypothetical protein [bacterium]